MFREKESCWKEPLENCKAEKHDSWKLFTFSDDVRVVNSDAAWSRKGKYDRRNDMDIRNEIGTQDIEDKKAGRDEQIVHWMKNYVPRYSEGDKESQEEKNYKVRGV